MLTTKEFAREVGAPYTTVMGWLRDGRIPEAQFDNTNPRGGVWSIPLSVVPRFKNPETRPQKGRPPKPGASGANKGKAK